MWRLCRIRHKRHQLLVDQGNSSLFHGSETPVLDEYVWLGGRSVAVIRSNLSTAWAHQADSTGTCMRNDDLAPPNCGIYFPVTDVMVESRFVGNFDGRNFPAGLRLPV